MRSNKTGVSLLTVLLIIGAIHIVSGSLPQSDGKKRKIEMINSDIYTYDRRIIANADRALGNAVFKHNNVFLYCDSAYFYKDSNMVDAFGHVHIIQGDSLNLYGDKINYQGNSKIASIHGNVKMINKSITLTTDELIFDLKTNIGNYHTWGKIVDTANVLVSKIGRYYSNEDLCFFKDSVKVTNKDFILTADTLKYNTKTERVFIVGPTHIKGTNKKGTLYSEKGWYDTRKNIAELYKSSRIMGKEQTLQGDTIYYSRNEGSGKARSKVLLRDTTNHILISGRYGVYNEKSRIAFVTDSAVFMQYSPKDTLYLHADTLKSVPDLSKPEPVKKAEAPLVTPKKSAHAKGDTARIAAKPPLADANAVVQKTGKADSTQNLPSAKNIADTLHVDPTVHLAEVRKDSLAGKQDTTKLAGVKPILTHKENPLYRDSLSAVPDTANDKEKKLFLAFHRVRFYRKDMQGLCDSLSYQMKDSVMRLFKDPVMWSDAHQLTGDRIEYKPHKPGPDIAKLENNGFIISREDSVKFNQISGKSMIGYIRNNQLKSIDVNGNAVTLYYLKNKDRYSGMNKLESSKISVFLTEGKMDSISFFPSPEGKTIPLKELTPDESVLKGFDWREKERPANRHDIYPLDEKRKKIAGPEKKPASKHK
ncbi:MAG: hypothetical protein LWW85_11700 [Marinilabiliales bacterium]|nr:hypothetical protein [Marinilabiliales bacterium]